MNIETIINYIISPELQEQLFLVRIVFLVFTGFFALAFIYYLLKTEWLREFILRDIGEFFSQRAVLAGRLARQWEKIKKRVEEGAAEPDMKLSIIEADSLVEDVLEGMGYKGETLEERLKQVPPTIVSSPEQLLEIHRIRDNVVHDPDFRLTVGQAIDVLTVYEKALRDMEVL